MLVLLVFGFLFLVFCEEGKCKVNSPKKCGDGSGGKKYDEIVSQIKKYGEEYRDYVAGILSDQVKIKGYSLGEKEIAHLILKQMEEAGFDEVRIDGLGNVIGRIGSGDTILAFDGHIDTVEVGNLDNWDLDPFSGLIKDGFVHGRGTADQRGGVAASIAAGKILKKMGFDKDLTIYVVGSVIEEDCDGLCWKWIVEEEGIKPDYFVSTESTDCKIYRGQRGRMEIEVDFRGISCHASAPHRGKNAIYMASKFAMEVEKLNERLADDEFLGKGTIAVTEFISQSPSLCAVSDYVKVHLDRRLTWGETEELAVGEIKTIIDELNLSETSNVWVLDYEEVSYTGQKYGMKKYYPTWKTEEDHPIVTIAQQAFKTLYDSEADVHRWTFSTNGVTVSGIHKVPAIGFGPGSESMAHAPNEKTPIDDLVKSMMFYAMYAYHIADHHSE